MAKRYIIHSRRARTATLSLAERYERYVEQYERRVQSLERRNVTPSQKTPYHFERFVEIYENKRLEGISATNATREIVSGQLYNVSMEEARSLKAYLEATDTEGAEEISIDTLRTNKDYWEINLSKLNESLKRSEPSGTKRQQFISYTIFGSE